MAINSPRIAAGPTKPRGHVLDQRVKTHPVEPGEDYVTTTNGTTELVVVDPPTREGQIYFRPQVSGVNRWATMYIGVTVNFALTWVPAFAGDIVNSYTGLPFDPINDA